MKRQIAWIGLAAMMAAWPASGRALDEDPTMQPQADTAKTDVVKDTDTASVINAWPENTKIAALYLIQKYGAPDGVTAERLSWNDKDPWSRVTLFREGVSDNFPTTHRNFLENTIHYSVPQEKAGELIKFDPALTVDRTAGTLSARSDSEQANILALNLADEIVRGKRDVDSARVFMRDTLRKSAAGKSSPYTDHLLFPMEK